MKICKHCKTEFVHENKNYGLGVVCRTCKNGIYRYGMNRLEQLQLLEDQKGKCALCEQPVSLHVGGNNNGVIDHCHDSGKVRGVLCSLCNVALGRLEKTNIDAFLKNIKKYLTTEIL